MLRKKFFKILSVLVAVIIAFSCFFSSLTASASNIQGKKQIGFNSTWSIFWNDYGSQIFGIQPVLQSDGSYRIETSAVSPVDFPQYKLTVVGSFDTSSLVGSTVDLSFEVADVFDTWIPLFSYNGEDTHMDVGSSSCYPDKLKTDDGTEGFHFVMKNYKVENSTTSFFLSLWLKSPSNYDQVFNIYILQNAFVSGSDTSIQDSTNQIINNQDKTASEIKANQDQNTNKIINGGKDSPGYSSVDKSTTDDYQSAEDEINNKTVSARSSTVSFFNNFGALLNDTPVQRGLLAVSKIMTEFFNIGWFAGLIQFALGIGAFAFILGSVIMVVGKVSSRSNSRSDSWRKK